MERLHSPVGGYWFIPAIRAYSAGVAADAQHQIVHIRLARPCRWIVDGADVIRRIVQEEFHRPIQALCGIELRSPRAMSYGQFAAFNRSFSAQLDRLGATLDGVTPIARTNVIPGSRPPDEPMLVAFSLCLPATDRSIETFVISGAAESSRLAASSVVDLGDSSEAARVRKAAFVISLLEARIAALEVGTIQLATPTIYSLWPPDRTILDQILDRLRPYQAAVTYCLAGPPIRSVEFEMDLRAVAEEVTISPAGPPRG